MSTQIQGKSNPCALTCANDKRGALLVVGAAPSMAKGTAGVESASGAQKAATARLEALEPGHMEGQRAGAKGQG